MSEVDKYGVPLRAFGAVVPPEFFEVLGRILAVNGRIEYLRDRLEHLPAQETTGLRKLEQFIKRCGTGTMDRNAIVHSSWVFGVHTKDPEVILGVRYKVRRNSSGQTAQVAIRGVPESSREQDVVQYRLEDLRKLLKRDVATLRVGEIAYAAVMERSVRL